MLVPESGQVVSNAYHGTTLESWGVIAKSGFRLPPENDPFRLRKWFGRGIYFYDGDLELAKKWPLDAKDGTRLVVLRSAVRLGKMLDTQVGSVKLALKKTAEQLLKVGVPLAEITDASVIDYLAKKMDFDTVRGTGRIFKKPDDIHFKSQIPDLSALIICVKKVDMISDTCSVCEHVRRQ